MLGQVVRYGYCNTVSNQGVCWAFMADLGYSRGLANKESVLFPSTYVLGVRSFQVKLLSEAFR